MAQLPTTRHFSFVFVPAEESAPVEERRFDGASDDELKAMMGRHFSGATMSNGQRQELASHLRAKVSEQHERQRAAAPVADAAADVPPSAPDLDPLFEQVMSGGSYEIVPLVMPSRNNGFIGTSLYIDDTGRFKELPLNSRASRMASKDIRGDAFLLSNHDDPALDDWERVDCTRDVYDRLLASPAQALDTANQSAMLKASLARDLETKAISAEDAAASVAAKAAGNAAFAASRLEEAVAAYTTCIDKSTGRYDLLPNAAEVVAARQAALLNRSLCYLRQQAFAAAASDARLVIDTLDKGSAKAWFRLASAQLGQNDFEAARASVAAYLACGGVATDIAALQQQIAESERNYNESMKKRFAKMFA